MQALQLNVGSHSRDFLDSLIGFNKENSIGPAALSTSVEVIEVVGTNADGRSDEEGRMELPRQHLAAECQRSREARVAERTRIARELHDTLLQSFNGLLLKFQTVWEMLPRRPAEARELLGSAINQANKALTETREAVQGLRTAVEEANGLAAAIGALCEELATDPPSDRGDSIRFVVEGSQRPLHPVVRDGVYRIAVEALRNARQHSQCTQIEVEVSFNRQRFRLRVRDDGKGIKAGALAPDKWEGHYGLCGMREHAELIAGTLKVWSGPGAGTEIELTIAAAHAYIKTFTAKSHRRSNS